MGVDGNEGFGERVKEFFTQTPEDREYEDRGGDQRVPVEDRTDDPKADAKRLAAANGEDDPHPDYNPDGAAVAEDPAPSAVTDDESA